MNVYINEEGNNFIREEDVRRLIRPRPRDAHKGICGRVLICAGSLGMAGAAILSARAALRSGAGLVTVACPVYLFHIIQTAVPEATCIDEKTLTSRSLGIYDAIAFGPGVGCTAERYLQLEHILLSYRGPVIVDADGINSICAFGSAPDRMEEPVPPASRRRTCLLPDIVARRKGEVILTPHPGEASRLLEALEEPGYHELTREEAARTLTRRTGAILVLKGAQTLVQAPGEDPRINTTGNPGMATGGSGDVLTGVLAALTAYGHAAKEFEPALTPYEAACCSVYLHGLAGDLAAEEKGEYGMTSMDIAQTLPAAFRQVTGR